MNAIIGAGRTLPLEFRLLKAHPEPWLPVHSILAAKLLALGLSLNWDTELQRLEQLPWPRNLFDELASIAELMVESAHAGENADGACSYGCRTEHKQNVADAAEPVRSRLRCYLLSLGSLQEQVEPGAEAETGR